MPLLFVFLSPLIFFHISRLDRPAEDTFSSQNLAAKPFPRQNQSNSIPSASSDVHWDRPRAPDGRFDPSQLCFDSGSAAVAGGAQQLTQSS
ncbi:hypothetical protein ACLOJK_000484 [Asimina triloba]